MQRRDYLDWLRGVGVVIMIWAHTIDAWTRDADRASHFRWALVVGGFGAPIFLFLAGITLALAAGARLRRGGQSADVAALARRRGWQVFGLAFLFRLQSWLISGGDPARSLLKVDILNVMGISMVIAAAVWALGRDSRHRAWWLAAAAALVALTTPLVRAMPVLDALPDPLEWYLRPNPGRTTFTLFPWSAFLLAGAAVGQWLDVAADAAAERRVAIRLSVVGPAVAAGGYLASLLPPIYAQTSFWTSSPTFFFIRLGILLSAVPLAYVWCRRATGPSPLRQLGMASLFVYWVHVELVYGIVSRPLHRQLPLTEAAVAFTVFTLFVYALVRLKGQIVGFALQFAPSFVPLGAGKRQS